MAGDKESRDAIEQQKAVDSTYFIEAQLLSTILSVGESRNKVEDKEEKKKLPGVLDFILHYDITAEYFHDPQMREVFEYIQKSATDSETSDCPSMLDLEGKFEGISTLVSSPTNNVNTLISEAREAKLFHEMSAIMSTTAQKLRTNSNDAFSYLQSQLDKLGTVGLNKPFDIISQAQERYDKREEKKKNGGQDVCSTGFKELDKDISGLANGEELFVLFARTGVGKAQPLDSYVLTPKGYKRMGNIRKGDEIITGTAEVAKVFEVFPQGEIDYYNVYLRGQDGKERIVKCSREHLWKVKGKSDKGYKVYPLFYLEQHIPQKFQLDLVHPKSHKIYDLFYTIEKIEYAGKTECQCIMVNHPDHTYVTNYGVVTHNTWMLLQILHECWKSGRNVAMIEPEMTPNSVGYRFDTLEGRGKYSNRALNNGIDMENEDEYKSYIKELGEREKHFYCVHPNHFGDRITVSLLKSFCKQHKIQVLGVDGLSYMDDERSKSSDSTSVMLTHIAADLMSLSIELGIPVIAIVQSNRENGVAQGGKLALDNIRDSDGIAYSASKVCGLYKKNDVLHVQLLKSRFGPVGQTYAYNWDIDRGLFSFLGYGDVDDEEFGDDPNRKPSGATYRARSYNPKDTRMSARTKPKNDAFQHEQDRRDSMRNQEDEF